MKVLIVFAALVCVSFAIVLPTPIKPTPISRCNCNCPINPLANKSDKEGVVCRCPACPTCNCKPCLVKPIDPIADATMDNEAAVSAPEQLLPFPPRILCKCASCPPRWNPPECDCEGSCPLIRCFCAECVTVQ